MSTGLAPGSRWPGDGRTARAMMWLGHYQDFMFLAAAGLGVAYYLSGQPGWLSDLASVVMITWFAAFWAGTCRHDRRLCERCVSEAPVLDPQGAVSRWRRILRLWHLRRVNILVMLAAIGGIAGSAYIRHESLLANALGALSLAVIGWMVFTGHIHRRLQPWCPWCRWGDGGDEEVSPLVPEDHGALR